LLCEAAEELGDATLLARVRIIALQMAGAVFNEGYGADGGLCYEGRDRQIIDAGHEGWPQAEALVGFLNAYQLSGNKTYFAAAEETWKFIAEHLIDRVHGEWFWRINPDGQPDNKLPKVSEWKGPYHATRACLETLKRLRGL
jgi:mannobiose 2-epimerase